MTASSRPDNRIPLSDPVSFLPPKRATKGSTLKRVSAAVAGFVIIAGVGLGWAMRDQDGDPSDRARTQQARVTFMRPLAVGEVVGWTRRYDLRLEQLAIRFQREGETVSAFYEVPANASSEAIVKNFNRHLARGLVGLNPGVNSLQTNAQRAAVAKLRGQAEAGALKVNEITISGRESALREARKDRLVRFFADKATLEALIRSQQRSTP